MLGLFARVVIGVVAGVIIGETVYRIISKDLIRDEVKNRIPADKMSKGLMARIKEAEKDSVKVEVLDSFDDPIIDEITVQGDEIADDVQVGDEFMIYDDGCILDF